MPPADPTLPGRLRGVPARLGWKGRERHRFRGQIAGIGSSSGVRVVVGRWEDSPLGDFADAMVEARDGHRTLIAPSDAVADYVRSTYVFDETRVEPILVRVDERSWNIESLSLQLWLRMGGRLPLGRLLHGIPDRLATHPVWATICDPVARVLLRGVRTRGTAAGNRREYYGATDIRAVTAISGTFEGRSLGALAPVDPPCRFGFSSTPRTPSVTEVVTTVSVPRRVSSPRPRS